MEKQLSKTHAAWLLSALIITRSTSFLFSKMLLVSMSLFDLLSMRFILTFLLLAVLFRKKVRTVTAAELKNGFILGICFTGVMFCEMMCLKSCNTSTTSFLENSAIVIVPLINMFLTHKKPERSALAASFCALSGVALLTVCTAMQSLTLGFLFGIMAALLYSIAIILTGRYSKSGNSLLTGITLTPAIRHGCFLQPLLAAKRNGSEADHLVTTGFPSASTNTVNPPE